MVENKFHEYRKWVFLWGLFLDGQKTIQKEITKLMSDHQYLDSIMIEGRDKASIIADSVLSKVYKIIGLNKL